MLRTRRAAEPETHLVHVPRRNRKSQNFERVDQFTTRTRSHGSPQRLYAGGEARFAVIWAVMECGHGSGRLEVVVWPYIYGMVNMQATLTWYVLNGISRSYGSNMVQRSDSCLLGIARIGTKASKNAAATKEKKPRGSPTDDSRVKEETVPGFTSLPATSKMSALELRKALMEPPRQAPPPELPAWTKPAGNSTKDADAAEQQQDQIEHASLSLGELSKRLPLPGETDVGQGFSHASRTTRPITAKASGHSTAAATDVENGGGDGQHEANARLPTSQMHDTGIEVTPKRRMRIGGAPWSGGHAPYVPFAEKHKEVRLRRQAKRLNKFVGLARGSQDIQTAKTASNDTSAKMRRKADARECYALLRRLVSAKECSNQDGPKCSVATLRELYQTSLAHNLLHQMSDFELSELIRTFGTVALPKWQKPYRSLYHSKLHGISEEAGREKVYWSTVTEVAKLKTSLNRRHTSSDHYWLMRAHLVEAEELYKRDRNDRKRT
jgi:hypothetical protein